MPPKEKVPRRVSCGNCRKAKKKCDGNVPCQRCASKHLLCKDPESYYPNNALQQNRRLPRLRNEAITIPSNRKTLTSASDAAELSFIAKTVSRRKHLNVTSPSEDTPTFGHKLSTSSKKAESVIHSDSHVSLKQQPCISWEEVAYQSFLPRMMYQSKSRGLLVPWQLVLDLQGEDLPLAMNVAVKAYTLQAFSNEVPEMVGQALVAEGVRQYGKALSLVNAQLRQTQTEVSSGLIVSVMGLAAYGFLRGFKFHNHVAGLREMFRLRGTLLLSDEPSRRLLKSFRDRAIIGAICQHADLPFDRQEHPWFFENLGNSDFDRLQTIALSLPDLKQQYMLLISSVDRMIEDHDDLITDTYATLASLHAWFQGLTEPEEGDSKQGRPPTGPLLTWYRLCEITCLEILDYSLTFLSNTDPDREDRSRHDVERGLISSTIREAFTSLGVDIAKLPQETPAHYDSALAAIGSLAPSGMLLQTLLLAAFTDESDETKRHELAARAHELISTRRSPVNHSPQDDIVRDADSGSQSPYRLAWNRRATAPLDAHVLQNITGLPQGCW